MQRSADSHKGDNGKVAIIGGSVHQHGAPLFSALAAEAAGADLLYVVLPGMHAEVAKSTSLNVQVYGFGNAVTPDEFTPKDHEMLIELLATMDCAVIGPGLTRTPKMLEALKTIFESAPCPFVADATALQPFTLKKLSHRQAVLTPHLGELERMGLEPSDVSGVAQQAGATILVKGVVDRIVSSTGLEKEVQGGNAGLTVGGTGDALAGLVASLIAQGMPQFDAAVTASTALKRAGALLFNDYGYAYGTRRVIECIPSVLRSL